MKDKLSIRNKLSRYFLIGSVTITIVIAMVYSFYSSSLMINRYSPLVNATMEIKLEATTAHLWLEEIISGDRYENLEDVIKHIDLALWYAKAMIEDGHNRKGTFLHLSDETLKKEVASTILHLKEFKEISFKRYKSKASSGIGSEIDRQYDKLFNDFISQIDNVETLLQQKIRADFNRYQIIQITLIIVTIIIGLIGFLIQHRYNRELTNNILNINKAKNRAKKNEQWLNIIMNSMGDAVITTDFDGNVTHINPVAEELLGWLESEAKGLALKTIFPIIDASTREPISNPVDKVISTGKTVYLGNHTTLVAKDGTEYQIADSAAPIRDADNNILGMVLVFNDVSENYRIREELNRSLQRLSLHWQDTPLGMIEWNTDFEFLDLNPAAEKIFGFSKAEIQGQHVTKNILSESTRETVDKIWADLLANTSKKCSLNKNLTKDGRTILCEWYNTPLVNEEGDVIGVSSLIIDITEKQIAEEKLQLSAKVFSETHEGITITDTKGIIIDVNPAFCKITGYSREEVIGQNPSILSSGKQSPDFYSEMWQTLNKYGHWQGEVWNRKKEGTLYAELLTISSLFDEEGNILYYVGIFSDITRSKKQQETLEQMAHYDVLTKLPNRVLLADRFTLALAHSKRQETLLAVCFLDLDNFKPVNDMYGHETGDQLLIEVAERIKSNIKIEDTVSRLGGDEFALLLGDIESFPQCELMLKHILESLAQPYVIDEQPHFISASIGVSLYPMDDADFDTLLRHADQAMYQAKLAGRNRYFLFNAKQARINVERQIRLKEVKKALVNSELSLYYQPKVNMATGNVFGAEALIRWNHPEKGLIPPIEFLPIIEETELEIQISNWCINEVLRQLDRWKEQGIELEVSVNISSYHLQSPSFVADLEKNLALYSKVHSKYLQLEILESSALGDLHAISSIIKTCINALGVNVALDDFGTGYSSLTHLRHLSAQTIKIDQTFVRDILVDPNDLAIIDSIIGLASSFNRKVIAEGVETTDHGLMLLIMGCNEAQGYGIARPMPVTKIPDWLSSYIPNQEWIACANKVRTIKENKIKLFRLTLAQWQKLFENKLQSSPGSTEQWPILKRTNCHCGIWIKRAKQEQLFDENWLIKLDEIHNTMHDTADDLFHTYQKGEVVNARECLKDLQIAVGNMNNILGQCE